MFNGPLYIPVVSLALLTEGRTARDLPKQRRSKKSCKKVIEDVRHFVGQASEEKQTEKLKKQVGMLLREAKILENKHARF